MRRPSARLVLGLSIPFLVILVLLAAWAIDSSSASGKVPRNVSLGSRDISKLSEDDLAVAVADLADRYAEVEVQVRTSKQTYKVPAGDLGLELDQSATVTDALELDGETALAARPFVWASSFLHERNAPLSFTVDSTALDTALADLAGNASPTEPKLVVSGDAITFVSGTSGRKVEPAGVADQLLARARSGEEPIVVDATVTDTDPEVSDADAKDVADLLTLATANGLWVTAGDETAAFDASTVRGWLGSKITDAGKIAPTIDAEQANAAVVAAIPIDTKAKNASITLTDDTPTITPSTDGKSCCEPDTADRILAAIKDGKGSVDVDLIVDEAPFSTEDAEKLGIKEPVGTTTEWNGQPQVKSFTTYHKCCADRVTNIQKMADIVRGTLVKPGETFSINDVVGERTLEKGFVPAGAIAYGEHVDEVGGGVSQFATTMFNAAYFAGLDITVSQAHSEYFSRYPRGREATMGFPNPDLAWINDTPYGILVWTSYTDTSLTITMYSTQYAYSEQTGSKESRSGDCTVVTTERTTHYPDKANHVESFTARYRDEGATSC